MLGLNMVIVWAILGVALLIIESMTVSLTSIWFALGAFSAMVLAIFALPFWAQVVSFLVVSVVMAIFTRPVFVKYLKIGTTKTNVDSLIGKEAIVTMVIEPFKTGQVKLNGQIWTALSENHEPIEVAQRVEVLRIEGVKLIVKEITTI
jgi:membrane protein implicated in regulation of membrane protease activity